MTQTPILNSEASLVLTQYFPLNGIFPSQGGGGTFFFLGEIGTFAGNFVPAGFGTSGQLLPINQNQAVFSLLGTTYGGDGTTNFALPNLDGRTMVGTGQGPGLSPETIGEQSGASTVVLTSASKPPDIGGSSQPFDNRQPSLAITYEIALQGVFPSQGGGSTPLDTLGMIMAFAGNFNAGGWTACNGQLLAIAQNTALFSILGTTYGGNGTTTFALPDLRGRDIIGASTTDPVGTLVGQENVNLANGQAPDGLGNPVTPFDNRQPSLAMEYLIAMQGIFPTQGGSQDGTTPFLGQIVAFAGTFVPSGWAACNGQLLSIAQNNALFALIGTTYGGDGFTTFALPDLRDRTVLGQGGNLPVGTAFGSNNVTVTSAELPTTAYVVSGGQTSTGLTLFIGDTITILSGGTASTTIAKAGAGGIVSAGGIARETTLSGGSQAVFGTASGTTILSRGVEVVSFGGVASGTVVSSGGVEVVSSGGVASGATVSGGGYQLDYGNASGTTLGATGNQFIFDGASATGTTVSSGAVQYVVAGGTASGVTVSGGGYQLDYGAASDTTVGPLGNQFVFGSAFSNTIGSGAVQDVLSGALASGTIVSGSGSYQLDSGTVIDTTLTAEANQFIFIGASAIGTTVSSGSLQYIVAGGTASGVTVSSGGLQYDYGSVISTTFISGGLGYVFSGGSASATVLGSGAVQEIFSSGSAVGGTLSSGATLYDLGTVSSVSVNGGALYVYNSATSTTVSSGGAELVFGAAVDSGGIVSNGGVQYVSGTARNDIVRGGTQNVYGTASGTVVSSGYQMVMAGGATSNTVVSSGGNQFVYGTASGTVVSSGGYGLVLSGGQVNGATLSGGLLEFQSGGTAGTSTITIASGTLRLDNSQNFGGGAQISGLTTAAQELDLADISFATASLLGYTGDTLSGILTVGDGTHTATLSLLGNYTFASFKLANDGGGGTLVVDPPFAAGEPPFLAQPTHT